MAGIFISYRQSDSAGWANWLYTRLGQEFGAASVFRDVSSNEPGIDYVAAVEHGVAQCDVLIAVIGPRWLTIKDKNGKRRLDNPRDLVRLEIERALARDIRVIPLLTDDASMPREDSLPESLKLLAFRNAVVVTNDNADSDVHRLIEVLRKVKRESPPSNPPSVVPPLTPVPDPKMGPRSSRSKALWPEILFALVLPNAVLLLEYTVQVETLRSQSINSRATIGVYAGIGLFIAARTLVTRWSGPPSTTGSIALSWIGFGLTVFVLLVAALGSTNGDSLVALNLLIAVVAGFAFLWRHHARKRATATPPAQ